MRNTVTDEDGATQDEMWEEKFPMYGAYNLLFVLLAPLDEISIHGTGPRFPLSQGQAPAYAGASLCG